MILARRWWAVTVIAAHSMVAGCDQATPKSVTSPPVTLKVADSSPYLCDLIPEKAFRRVTGLAMPVDARWVNGPQHDNGLCLAYVRGREAPLGVNWSYNDGERIVRGQQEYWADETPRSLPSGLGRGLAVVVPLSGAVARPNYVIALFRCGKWKPWIRIDFAPVVRGRDAVQDMIDFMEIAQRRFGQLHKCMPEPL